MTQCPRYLQRTVKLIKMKAFLMLEFAYPRNGILTINVDSTAWNNKFSQATVDPVMKETVSGIFNT